MKHLVFTFLITLSLDVFAGNYATCLLDKAPGLQNDAAAQAAINFCMKEYPSGVNSVARGSGRGWFSYKSGSECALKKAADTHSQLAGRAIFLACNLLYDEPKLLLSDDDVFVKQK